MKTKKARMGRPPKPPGEKQSVKVTVKLTPGERRRLDAEARKAGAPLATYIMAPHRAGRNP